MTIHRFFIPDELIQGDEVFFPADMAHQIARVLRLQVGDTVLVLDGSGLERVVRLHEVAKRAAQGTVEATRPNRNEPRTHVTLYMALVKGKKMEWVLQKGTELGVSRFVPVLTDRSVIGSLDDVGDAKLDRWEAIVREAAEQSERARLPEVVEPQRFDVALGQARLAGGLLLLPWEGGGTEPAPPPSPGGGPPAGGAAPVHRAGGGLHRGRGDHGPRLWRAARDPGAAHPPRRDRGPGGAGRHLLRAGRVGTGQRLTRTQPIATIKEARLL